MKWVKKGVIWKPKGNRDWAKTHGSVPTPVILENDTIRIYVSCLDEQGRARPGYFEVSSIDPTIIKKDLVGPILDIGRPGTFDDNGVMVTSVLAVDKKVWLLYYAGFELCEKIRYRIFTGCALSDDGGLSFKKVSECPVLDRNDNDIFFRGGPFAFKNKDKYHLVYVGGSDWIDLYGKMMPVYSLKMITSDDGIKWNNTSKKIMEIDQSVEHGFGRPWIEKREGIFHLFFSVRNRGFGQYRLGYAKSYDLENWDRDDSKLGLDVSKEGFDSTAIMYSSIVQTGKSIFCFYNGNNFGKDGVGLAELTDGF